MSLYGTMTEAEWLISGMLNMCDEWRARQRWDTESEEKGEVRLRRWTKTDRDKVLTLKMNEKLSFTSQKRQKRDAEIDDEWEARLCQHREREARCWEWRQSRSLASLAKRDKQRRAALDHWTPSCLSYVLTLLFHVSMTFDYHVKLGLPPCPILRKLTRSHSSSPLMIIICLVILESSFTTERISTPFLCLILGPKKPSPHPHSKLISVETPTCPVGYPGKRLKLMSG